MFMHIYMYIRFKYTSAYVEVEVSNVQVKFSMCLTY
jgi:hypothetical protein